MARVLGFLSMALFVGTVYAADTHHNGHDLIKGKGDGKHEIHSSGNHTAHAHVIGGKVKEVTVNHKTKGAVKVNKYKSSKKYHAGIDPTTGDIHVFAGDPQVSATLFVGFGFINDQGILVIFWFPVDIVIGGDSGSMDYNG